MNKLALIACLLVSLGMASTNARGQGKRTKKAPAPRAGVPKKVVEKQLAAGDLYLVQRPFPAATSPVFVEELRSRLAKDKDWLPDSEDPLAFSVGPGATVVVKEVTGEVAECYLWLQGERPKDARLLYALPMHFAKPSGRNSRSRNPDAYVQLVGRGKSVAGLGLSE